jgi:hypothetical protein
MKGGTMPTVLQDTVRIVPPSRTPILPTAPLDPVPVEDAGATAPKPFDPEVRPVLERADLGTAAAAR